MESDGLIFVLAPFEHGMVIGKQIGRVIHRVQSEFNRVFMSRIGVSQNFQFVFNLTFRLRCGNSAQIGVDSRRDELESLPKYGIQLVVESPNVDTKAGSDADSNQEVDPLELKEVELFGESHSSLISNFSVL